MLLLLLLFIFHFLPLFLTFSNKISSLITPLLSRCHQLINRIQLDPLTNILLFEIYEILIQRQLIKDIRTKLIKLDPLPIVFGYFSKKLMELMYSYPLGASDIFCECHTILNYHKLERKKYVLIFSQLKNSLTKSFFNLMASLIVLIVLMTLCHDDFFFY